MNGKIAKKLVEIRRKELEEDAKLEYKEQLILIKEYLPKAAGKRRQRLLDEESHLDFNIRHGHYTIHNGTYGRSIIRVYDLMKIRRDQKRLDEVIDAKKHWYVRSKAQKEKVTQLLKEEAKTDYETKIKKIGKDISEDCNDLINPMKFQYMINYTYNKYITKEFAEKNNLFFYFKDIDTVNPSESVNPDGNLIVVPICASIVDIDFENERSVIDVSYDWSTSSGSAWGTRTAGFYAGIDDGQVFIERIPYGTSTIEDAEEWLKPAEVKKAEAEGRRVKRQGDVFLIEMKRRATMAPPSSHQVRETEKGFEIEHPQHGLLRLEGHNWKSVQRKTMSSHAYD